MERIHKEEEEVDAIPVAGWRFAVWCEDDHLHMDIYQIKGLRKKIHIESHVAAIAMEEGVESMFCTL